MTDSMDVRAGIMAVVVVMTVVMNVWMVMALVDRRRRRRSYPWGHGNHPEKREGKEECK